MCACSIKHYTCVNKLNIIFLIKINDSGISLGSRINIAFYISKYFNYTSYLSSCTLHITVCIAVVVMNLHILLLRVMHFMQLSKPGY